VIIRISEDGKAYATSPQAPGLVYGRRSLAELRNDLTDVLSFHFELPGPFHVVEHVEHHYDVATGELVIRVAQDTRKAEREIVAERIRQIAGDPEEAQSLLSTADLVGETVYICAIPSDTLGWVAAQLRLEDVVHIITPQHQTPLALR
jgi:hypothetical protein